jgi:hypothetical protein
MEARVGEASPPLSLGRRARSFGHEVRDSSRWRCRKNRGSTGAVPSPCEQGFAPKAASATTCETGSAWPSFAVIFEMPTTPPGSDLAARSHTLRQLCGTSATVAESEAEVDSSNIISNNDLSRMIGG